MTGYSNPAAVLFLCCAQAAAAQEDLHSVDCVFDRVCSWPDGCDAQDMEMAFAFDPASGFGLVSSAAGNAIIRVEMGRQRDGARVVTFTQTPPWGAVSNTTVADSGDAVHSRHSVMSGSIIATQHYGICNLEAWW